MSVHFSGDTTHFIGRWDANQKQVPRKVLEEKLGTFPRYTTADYYVFHDVSANKVDDALKRLASQGAKKVDHFTSPGRVAGDAVIVETGKRLAQLRKISTQAMGEIVTATKGIAKKAFKILV